MKEFRPNPLQNNRRLVTSCPFCGASVDRLDVKTVSQMDDHQIIHIHCASCLGSLVALFYVGGSGLNSVGLATDLSFDDWVKFAEHNEIDMDDVLKVHELLKSPEFFKIL